MVNKKLVSVELSLHALESIDYEAYVDEIHEILFCIEANRAYDDAPELSVQDLKTIIEGLCRRYGPIDSYHPPGLYNLIYDQNNFSDIKKKIRNILIKNI